MTTVTPSVLFHKASVINHHPVSQDMQSPRFSGDAFEIHHRLKQKAEAAEAAKAEVAEQKRKDDAFKEICNPVVWQQGNDTLTVGEMVAFLCRKRPDENYPGYGTAATLAKDFPGMNIEALSKGFEQLHNNASNPCYLGSDDKEKSYWLRPIGEGMIEKLYPDITLPPKKERFTNLSHIKTFL